MSRASDIAYREIRQRILSGDLPPRSQLKEEELAELCGVSRTPVRDALRRLEAEMLVRRSDTQRTFVPDWSLDEIEEIFTLRVLIEGQAAARAATRATPEQLARMRAINQTIRDIVYGLDPLDGDAFVSANKEFHGILFEAACSERLTKMRALLVEQVIVHHTVRTYDRQGLQRSQADHEELVNALESHDAEWAQAIMVSHIRRAYTAVIAEVSALVRD